ncbi:site-specific tyrosine recombinase XerC [Symmachiella macrocystis]|uniref:Site-specific tyrosine recombinase XerC n=1 Tax=Symmachiella macrocystis TaxID=2527985 RepID=A0A5C6BA96_9PLAN|nr:site-specific integrase [Symmachiella macrocystis]TWU08898.1 site-specific tyrosine recombinase XerC [Symmachiella macrocystis]
MATLFKKQFTKPIPTAAKIFTRTVKGEAKRFAQWTDRKGKQRTAELTAVGERLKYEAGTWTAKFRDGEGKVCEVATGCRDKQAAQSVLDELLRRSELVKARVLSPQQDKIADHQRTPLSDHLKAYVEHLKSRGVHSDRVKTMETRMEQTANACRWRWLSDLNVDSREKWLRTLTEEPIEDETPAKAISASVYNGFVESWVAFGFWCIGKRMAGKRYHFNGEKRLLVNPFEGMGRRDAKQDRRRIARAMTEDELTRLLDAARRRPLEDAMTIRTGPRKGEVAANVSDERTAKLRKLGQERSLIYKTFVLTGMRADELRTLKVADVSFGDVPFIKLQHTNEKSRKGSTIPLRSDLAADLREWIKGHDRTETVFNVPAGILRIMNRDLIAAGIDKTDADGRIIHVHALRHSFGTHLSRAGVAPRVAQAAMRHSDISLTMNTYTDARLLDTAEAVEALQIARETDSRTLAPTLAPNMGIVGQVESHSDHSTEDGGDDIETKEARKTQGFTGLSSVEVSEDLLNFSSPRWLSGTAMFLTSSWRRRRSWQQAIQPSAPIDTKATPVSLRHISKGSHHVREFFWLHGSRLLGTSGRTSDRNESFIGCTVIAALPL